MHKILDLQEIISVGRMALGMLLQGLTFENIEEQTPEWCLAKIKEINKASIGNTEILTYLSLAFPHKEFNLQLLSLLGRRAQGSLSRPELVNIIFCGKTLEQIDRMKGEDLPWIREATKNFLKLFFNKKLMPTVVGKTTLYPSSFFSEAIPVLFMKIYSLGGSLDFAWDE